MSFFDDEDDAIEEEPHREARPSADARPRGSVAPDRPRSGGSRRPPSTRDPAIERRRWVAGVAIVVVVILVILLISSCQARDTKNSLEDYNNSVSSLISHSDDTGAAVFKILDSGASGSTMTNNLATPLGAADDELNQAKSLSVPDQMSTAQSHLVLALQMRYDGLSTIASQISSTGGSGSQATSAVTAIAGATAQFYASDVVYKDYVTTEIAEALNDDHISPGTSTSAINGGQFLPDLGWLSQSYIATKLGASTSSASAGSSGGSECPSGDTCGDALDAVSVGSNTLTAGVTNTVTGSPAPTFTISVTNGGQVSESNVKCTVSVSGGPSGSATIPSIPENTTGTCNVKLSASVTAGTYSVVVKIAKVPGETNLANNTATYSVQFQ